MKTLILLFIAIHIQTASGLRQPGQTHRHTTKACICKDARINGGWCPSCLVGYVAGVKIKSEMLFETIDAHGHDILPASFKCPLCQAALRTNGYCSRCRMGFVDQKAYLSPLTYYIATGRVVDRSKLSCERCRTNSGTRGWCDQCKVGMMGSVAIESRTEFDKAKIEFDRLLRAVRMLAECETCATALMTGGRCTKCKISYKLKEPTAKPSDEQLPSEPKHEVDEPREESSEQ